MTDEFSEAREARVDDAAQPCVAAHGVYRNDEPADAPPTVHVRFKSGDIDVPEDIYRQVGLQPDFQSLPTRAAYLTQSRGGL